MPVVNPETIAHDSHIETMFTTPGCRAVHSLHGTDDGRMSACGPLNHLKVAGEESRVCAVLIAKLAPLLLLSCATHIPVQPTVCSCCLAAFGCRTGPSQSAHLSCFSVPPVHLLVVADSNELCAVVVEVRLPHSRRVPQVRAHALAAAMYIPHLQAAHTSGGILACD